MEHDLICAYSGGKLLLMIIFGSFLKLESEHALYHPYIKKRCKLQYRLLGCLHLFQKSFELNL